MKNAVKAITLYTVKQYPDTELLVRHYIEGVSIHGSLAVNVGDNGFNAADVFTVRIPQECGEYAIKEGDIVVLGKADEASPRRADLDSKYQTLTVVSCTDNTGKRGGHYKVVCK